MSANLLKNYIDSCSITATLATILVSLILLYAVAKQPCTNDGPNDTEKFSGHRPILVTSDLDIIEEVFIKQFANFSSRPGTTQLQLFSEDDPRAHLFMAGGARWKRLRNIINPTFSSAKLREITPSLIMCTDRFIKMLQNKSQNQQDVDMTQALKLYTMDTIWNCAFGVDIDLQQSDKDLIYYQNCEIVFRKTESPNIILKMRTLIPELRFLITAGLIGIGRLYGRLQSNKKKFPYAWLIDNMTRIVKTRKDESAKRRDFLQLLLDAEHTDVDMNAKKTDYSASYFEKKLTNTELENNLLLFMMAGYDTTSTTLSMCFYVLAKYPQEQQKLLDEINATLDGVPDSEINGDNVKKLTYLDMFVKEVLRMYPIGTPNRRCVNATRVNGLDIPAELTIVANVLSVHYDAEIWGPVDPNEFYPERFLPEIKRPAAAFLGFGAGPRNCIGMKFATLETKITLVRVLKKFKISPGRDMPEDLEFLEMFVRKPTLPITVRLDERIESKI